MSLYPPEHTDSKPSVRTGSITALVVGDRLPTERLRTSPDEDGLAIRIEPSLPDEPGSLEAVDCLVLEYAGPSGNGVDRLDRLRRRTSDLPVVLLVDDLEESGTVVEAIQSHQWVDCIERTDALAVDGHLSHRIRMLVAHRRLAARSQRSRAGIELARDAIGIVTPDGAFEFVNRSFAVQFGYDRDELVGRPWQDLFTADGISRLESTAIPTVADDWRWSGTCIGRRKSDATVPVRVRLGGLEDGSLVFVVESLSTDESGSLA